MIKNKNMNKSIKWTLISLVGVIVIIALAGMYKFNYLAGKEGYDVDGNKEIVLKDGEQSIEQNVEEEEISIEYTNEKITDSNLMRFESEDLGFSFEYHTSYQVLAKESSGQIYVAKKGSFDRETEIFSLAVIYYENYVEIKGKKYNSVNEIKDAVSERNEECIAVPDCYTVFSEKIKEGIKEIKVDGREALEIYHFGEMRDKTIVILNPNGNFTVIDNYGDHDNYFEDFLASFKFLDEEESMGAYRMPIPNNKREYEGVELYYEYKEGSELGYNLFIKKSGKEKLLANDILFDGPGGSVPEFSKTNNPSVVLLKASMSDMGGYIKQYYYIDLNSEEILKIVETQDSLEINGNKLTLDIEEHCPARVGQGEYEGGTDYLKYVLVNGVKSYEYPSYIQLHCIDPGGLGDIYSNQPHIFFNRVDSYMDLVYFKIFGMYFYYDLKDSKLVANEIDVSNWQTYTNDKYGFSFEYPNDWDIYYDDDNQVSFNYSQSYLSTEFKLIVRQNPNKESVYDFYNNIDENKKIEGNEDLIYNWYALTEDYGSQKNLTIDGIEAVNFISPMGIMENTAVVIPEDDIIIEIQIRGHEEIEEGSEYEAILDSFKFLDEEDLTEYENNSTYIKDGSAYYKDENGLEIIIAQRVDGPEKEINNIVYKKSTLSPDGKFILLESVGWEWKNTGVYEINSKEIHKVNESGSTTLWLGDNRIRIEGECGMGISCGIFESINSKEPWQLERISDYQ